MIKVTVQKNLIGLEDLLVGVGTVTQNRGPTGTAPMTITKINGANFPYDDEYTMKEKFDALQILIDQLPIIVDEDGNLLAGWIFTSNLDLNLANRLWRKTINAHLAEIYYFNQLLFQYDPTDGNIIIPGGTDYIAADAVVTAAFEAADADILDIIDDLEASLKEGAFLDVGTAPLELVQLDATGKLPAVDGSQLTGLPGGVPIGTIVAVPYNTPDSGYLKCNGQTVSRTTYATLYGKIGDTYGDGDGSTTFELPDLRGEFIRGWDDARGVDASRVLGSAQADSVGSHSHAAGSLTAASAGAHQHTYTFGGTSPGSGATPTQAANGGNVDGTAPTKNSSSAGAHTHTITGSTAATGAPDTRPRNIALMYVIKAL